MYQYWRSNRNVILTAVALFVVSMTVLLFFLTYRADHDQHELKANVVDSISLKSHQEQEDSYRDLVNNHEDPLIVVMMDGEIEFVSWDFEPISGYKTADLEKQQFFSMMHPNDLPTFIADFGQVISTEQPQSIVGPYRIRKAEGDYMLSIATLHPIFEDNKLYSIAIISRDITNELPSNTEASSEEEETPPEEENPPKESPVGPPEEEETTSESDDTKIRDETNEDGTRLIVDKLAKLIDPSSHGH